MLASERSTLGNKKPVFFSSLLFKSGTRSGTNEKKKREGGETLDIAVCSYN
jgi:hypothetical protein